jgi:hypothetical protein
MHYFIVSPSRRYPCETHAARVAAGYTDPNPGDVPVVDDEYEEWLDVLQSVARTQDAYVMMELGARYGTWGVRALKAWERLRGTPARFIGVEADATFFTWMEEHVEHNNLTQYSTLLHQMAAKGKGTDLLSLVEKAQLDHIDYLDADIQLAEGDFFDHPATLTWMDQHVGAVHIGTHSDAVHARLKKRFESRGWTLLFAYAPGYHRGGHNCDNHLEKALQQQPDCMVESPYGKIYVRDGMLSFANGNRLGEPA